MGALSPLFLVAGVAVAVPLFLHLFQRQEARRVAFPALRYLERTEREHARRIRLRQLLLLLVRVAAIVALVGAGARVFLLAPGSAHPPTALAIVLDNSMSSGLVVGDSRRLDQLKRLALGTVARGTERDRIWVIRAGEPWIPAAPGGPVEARRAVEETAVSAAAGDLSAALARAAALVSNAGLEAREIHLLSDLQASAFTGGVDAPAGDVPVVVWVPERGPPMNRALTEVLVGGGLAPLEGQRAELTVTSAPGVAGDTAAVSVRAVLDGRVRGAGALPPGASVGVPLPPAPAGWTLGYVEADPDALRADDRRYFAFRSRPAPRLALSGDPGLFLTEAIAVLEGAGRLRRSEPPQADLIVAEAGEGLEDLGAGCAVLIFPPEDPTRLPALNRRLEAAGVPWRLEPAPQGGEVPLDGALVPEPLQGARVRRWYRPSLATDPSTPPRTLATAAGDPWAVEGTDPSGRRYLILASPLDAESTSLPVSAAMVRLVDWFATAWAPAGSTAPEHVAGNPLSAPRDADAVRLPSAAEVPLDGTRMVRATGEAGIYTFLAGDSAVSYVAVNPAAQESSLALLDGARLERSVGRSVTAVRREAAWDRSAFRARQGPVLTRFLVLAALAALLAEALLAAAGRLRSRPVAEGGRGVA